MTSLKWSRVILVGVFTFVSLLAGYVLFQYYDHLCKAERLRFFEHNQSLLDKLNRRARDLWQDALQDAMNHAKRVIAGSDRHQDKALKLIVSSKPCIRQAFLLDEQTIILPEWKKRRRPETTRILMPDVVEDPDFKRAEIFEYQYNDYAEAVKLYERFWLENPDNLRAANALARCLYKHGAYTRSEKIYRQIFTQNPLMASPGETPLAVIAAFQLLSIYQAQANTEAAYAFGRRLYNNLLDEQWALPEQRTDFFKQKTLTALQPFSLGQAEPEAIRRILQREKQLDTVKRYVRMIERRVIPFIESSVIRDYSVYFLTAKNQPTHFLLIIPQEKSHIILDIDYARFIHESLVQPLQTLAKDHGVGMALRFHQGAETIAAIQGGTPAEFSMAAPFPDLRLAIMLPDLPEIRLEARLVKLKTYFTAGFALFVLILALIYFVLDKQIQFADLKSDFVSHVSHELKTPLTSLRMFSELLQKNPGLPVKKRRQYYTIMNQESIRLSRLIENLLDISRIERKKSQYAFHPAVLDDVLKSAVEIFHYASADVPQQLKTQLRCRTKSLMLDKDAVIQLVLNILDNARKFSPKQSTIWLRSRLADGNAVVEIEDQGPGMSKQEIRKVFKTFYQVKKSYEDKFKGVGLGLAIVKNIAQAHHAEVRMTSTPGQGTIVRIAFPLDRDPQNAAPQTGKPEKNPPKG